MSVDGTVVWDDSDGGLNFGVRTSYAFGEYSDADVEPLCASVRLELRLDGWASEISVLFEDELGREIFSQARGTFKNFQTVVLAEACVDMNLCNGLLVLDSYGDGYVYSN
jgi:hypothetical protein